MAIMSTPSPEPAIAITVIASRIAGNAISTSSGRMITPSTTPPA
jgi:hypothetical protein